MKTTKRSITTRSTTRNNRTRVIASTPTPDRYSDVVAGGPESWDLSQYQANPVILWAHDYASNVPVGRAASLDFDKAGNLIATIEWNTATQLGRDVSKAYADGFLSAVSVGFQPANATERRKLPKDHPAYGETGMFFKGPNKLLEISAVNVPANGEALALRSADGTIGRHVLNVEETEDAYIVTYAKAQPVEDEDEPAEDVEELEMDDDEIEDEAYGDDEDDEDKEHGPDHDDEDDEAEGYGADDEDKEHEPGHDEDEEDEEDEEAAAAKAFRPIVRQALLELLGHDPDVRRALQPRTRSTRNRRTAGLSDLFGIDN